MSFAQDTGYLPNTISALMAIVRDNVNAQFGTSYVEETFLGTNFYKYFYALIQRLQENEVKTSEIFLRMQEYFNVTNENIQRPNTTHPGIISYFAARGWLASTKAPVVGDAGKIYICVNVDSTDPNYASKKLDICTIVKDCAVAGVISQGTESATITLPNLQSFDFKFNLPTKIPVKLKLTITLSANNQFTVKTHTEIAQALFVNINTRYRLGLAFEPQRYFSVVDAPWASSVLLQYSTDGGTTWSSTVYAAAYNELFTFAVSDISVVDA
jgi:hypothetical protein